jgi:hypothetical protein
MRGPRPRFLVLASLVRPWPLMVFRSSLTPPFPSLALEEALLEYREKGRPRQASRIARPRRSPDDNSRSASANGPRILAVEKTHGMRFSPSNDPVDRTEFSLDALDYPGRAQASKASKAGKFKQIGRRRGLLYLAVGEAAIVEIGGRARG